jgi:hypothetical protein
MPGGPLMRHNITDLGYENPARVIVATRLSAPIMV